MFRNVFYLLTAVVLVAQLFTIFGNRLFGEETVHPITVWTVAPSMILCFGILAIIETINRKKE